MDAVMRKLTATFAVTVIGSLVFSWLTVFDLDGGPYNRGNALVMWGYIFLLYIGAIVLVYGNLVSVLVEWFQKRVVPLPALVYVLIHSLFGGISGVVFESWMMGVAGGLLAGLYALIDRLIYLKNVTGKQLLLIWILPLVVVGVSWALLEWTSPDQPPFEAEDAVEQMTSGNGSRIEKFPDEVGTEVTESQGLTNERSTSVEKIGDETFLVTFTEKWSADSGEGGSWSMSYEVDEDSSMLRDSGGHRSPAP